MPDCLGMNYGHCLEKNSLQLGVRTFLALMWKARRMIALTWCLSL